MSPVRKNSGKTLMKSVPWRWSLPRPVQHTDAGRWRTSFLIKLHHQNVRHHNNFHCQKMGIIKNNTSALYTPQIQQQQQQISRQATTSCGSERARGAQTHTPTLGKNVTIN